MQQSFENQRRFSPIILMPPSNVKAHFIHTNFFIKYQLFTPFRFFDQTKYTAATSSQKVSKLGNTVGFKGIRNFSG
jgi:purine-nucleoside phosphorylase